MKNTDFQGTKTLVKLALRRDRIILPLWIIGIFFLITLITAVYGEFTPQDMAEMIIMASPSPGMRLLMAPAFPEYVDGLGTFFLVRMSLIITVLIGIMNIQLIIRHTRNNEDTGCTEMLASMEVGRYALLSAALTVAVITNILLSVFITLGFVVNGLPLLGSLAAGTSFGGIGLVFAGIAGITAQLSSRSRDGSSLAFLIKAFLILISSLSNVFGQLNQGGLGFQSASFTWVSPVGWVQQIHPFSKNNFWILPLFIILFLILVKGAFSLIDIRDIGSGIIPAKKGPEKAAQWMLNPLGLGWKLQRKGILGWAIPMIIFGAIMGGSSTEFGDFMENMEGFENMIINSENFLYVFIGLMASILLIYAKTGVMRMYSEEREGYAEGVLATAVSRTTWALSQLILTVLSSIIIMIAFSTSVALAAGVSSQSLSQFIKGGLYQSTGIIVVIGFSTAVYGLFPKVSKALSWIAVFASIFLGPFFGPLLNLPESVQKISPFTHIATFPQDVKLSNLLILIIISGLLALKGLAAFNKRDLKL
ncbi:ABC transporter permease [Anaerobranca gottschalkii]|uniref:ABC-2 type transport system permease protein n=1 Tax=Anaerobranca gottschalkii DSM 13577 TaxID=1120990 RepID=A0A1H9ZNT7_9FIRM|nr:hypothetical protein [Anaerobranca gottschalkii]SES83304.1 ABC-2 type transport system permease protein [Anaerobranca gottschalkii DSM 13577]